MKVYVMYIGSTYFLTFGNDAVIAAQAIVDEEEIEMDELSVGQSFTVEENQAFELDTSMGGVYLRPLR